MILPDTNVLIHAYRVEAPKHDAYRRWLDGAVNGHEPVAVCDIALNGMIRIASNRRVFPTAPPLTAALEFTEAIRTAPGVHTLQPNDTVWGQLRRFFEADPNLRAGQVTDAYLAALAVAHGARMATSDRGMARFEGLTLFDPIRGG